MLSELRRKLLLLPSMGRPDILGERFGREQQGQTLTPFLEALLMVTVPIDTGGRSGPWHAKPLASGHFSAPHPDSGLWERKVSSTTPCLHGGYHKEKKCP